MCAGFWLMQESRERLVMNVEEEEERGKRKEHSYG
jgi:hypothetical protein